MRCERIENMKKGWFVGNFEPSLFKTNDVVILSGRAKMFGTEWQAGDIVIAEPGDITDFTALEDTVNTVVKIPGINNDKYFAEKEDE